MCTPPNPRRKQKSSSKQKAYSTDAEHVQHWCFQKCRLPYWSSAWATGCPDRKTHTSERPSDLPLRPAEGGQGGEKLGVGGGGGGHSDLPQQSPHSRLAVAIHTMQCTWRTLQPLQQQRKNLQRWTMSRILISWLLARKDCPFEWPNWLTLRMDSVSLTWSPFSKCPTDSASTLLLLMSSSFKYELFLSDTPRILQLSAAKPFHEISNMRSPPLI